MPMKFNNCAQSSYTYITRSVIGKKLLAIIIMLLGNFKSHSVLKHLRLMFFYINIFAGNVKKYDASVIDS